MLVQVLFCKDVQQIRGKSDGPDWVQLGGNPLSPPTTQRKFLVDVPQSRRFCDQEKANLISTSTLKGVTNGSPYTTYIGISIKHPFEVPGNI